MEDKRTLLKKYEIPISHLDYDYIRSCTDTKELERIVAILRSGEEGYFPDLTKFAEDKLQGIKPNSKALRKEERILTKNSLSSDEWDEHNQPIKTWSTEIKNKDSILSTIQEKFEKIDDLCFPPIRKGGKVTGKQDKSSKSTTQSSTRQSASDSEGGSRIRTTDYGAWDKFDADAELLKMDLEEERVREHVERMNRINKEKSTVASAEDNNKKEMFEKLSNIEKEKLSEDYRIRGNECFHAKEYDNALLHYTRCIDILPSVACYNNRAITNIKLKRFTDALSDCNECLRLEPTNLKGLLRKADALHRLGKILDAFHIYQQIKSIDPSNEIAERYISCHKTELGEIPPTTATRIQITEETDEPPSKPIETPKPKPAPKPAPKPVNYDYAELIKPNKLVKSTLAKTMENIGKLTPNKDKGAPSKKGSVASIKEPEPEIKLRVEDPLTNNSQTGKCLIQEL